MSSGDDDVMIFLVDVDMDCGGVGGDTIVMEGGGRGLISSICSFSSQATCAR